MGEKVNRRSRDGPQAAPRKWKILEVFTWTCLISHIAASAGKWEFLEPITIEAKWDLRDAQTRQRAFDYLKKVEPDLLVVAWPCGPWSVMQQVNQRTPQQVASLRQKRLESRRCFLSFVRQIVLWQRNRGGAVVGENPFQSLAWKQAEVLDAFAGCAEAVLDQCQYGLKHPTTHQPMKKRTRFMGQKQVVKYLYKLCPGDHEHHPIEGNFKDEATGKWRSLSACAGGYHPELCKAILKGAEEFLRSNEAFVEQTPSRWGTFRKEKMRLKSKRSFKINLKVKVRRSSHLKKKLKMKINGTPFRRKFNEQWSMHTDSSGIQVGAHWWGCSKQVERLKMPFGMQTDGFAMCVQHAELQSTHKPPHQRWGPMDSTRCCTSTWSTSTMWGRRSMRASAFWTWGRWSTKPRWSRPGGVTMWLPSSWSIGSCCLVFQRRWCMIKVENLNRVSHCWWNNFPSQQRWRQLMLGGNYQQENVTEESWEWWCKRWSMSARWKAIVGCVLL